MPASGAGRRSAVRPQHGFGAQRMGRCCVEGAFLRLARRCARDSDLRTMIYTLPNLLTLMRIVFIPLFIILFLWPFSGHFIWAALVFGLASLTDFLDGYLAKSLNQGSPFGVFLDPVADKLLVATTLVLLVQQQPSLWLALPAVVLIGRELTVSALRAWMAEIGQNAKVAVLPSGKIKSGLQMVALLVLICVQSVRDWWWLYGIGITLLCLSLIFSIWSMLLYLKVFLYCVKQQTPTPSTPPHPAGGAGKRPAGARQTS